MNWWHRNPPDKPWSVNVLMSSGKGFYPDFIIGIEGRKTEDGALLADPKERFETSQEAPKVLAEHQTYGRVMILAKDGVRWMTVGYDEKARKPIFAQEFSLTDTPAFGTSGVQTMVAREASSVKIAQAETTMPASSSLTAPALGPIPEHAVVRLRHDLKAEDVKAGETGTVVHVYEGGSGYEVEFLGERKRPKLVTVEPADIELAD